MVLHFTDNNYDKSRFNAEKSMGVCETLQYAPGGKKVEKSYF